MPTITRAQQASPSNSPQAIWNAGSADVERLNACVTVIGPARTANPAN
jgi:hypothetical protein